MYMQYSPADMKTVLVGRFRNAEMISAKASKIIARFIDQPSRKNPEGEWNKKHQSLENMKCCFLDILKKIYQNLLGRIKSYYGCKFA